MAAPLSSGAGDPPQSDMELRQLESLDFALLESLEGVDADYDGALLGGGGGDSFAERRLTFEQVFDLLTMAQAGSFAPNIPVRPQASPICVQHKLFFVASNQHQLLTEHQRAIALGDPASLVGVKYQSFGNGEVWWSERHGQLRGVVARNMSRKVRSCKPGSCEDHGFGGRCYSLLQRKSTQEQSTRAILRAFVVADAPSLVQFWPVEGLARRKKKRKASYDATCGTSLDATSVAGTGTDTTGDADSVRSLGSGSVGYSGAATNGGGPRLISCLHDQNGEDGLVIVRGALRVEGDAAFSGNLTVRNLHVQGSLTVEGGINGQLVTPPGAADYAEWFAKLDPGQNIEPGEVVQLRSPEQKVSLETQGNGPIMVVSSKPSVAAGVPFGEEVANGVLCGFLGQVPVRVRGPVKVGDLLVPSGRNDGRAVAGNTINAGMYEPLGTAMEACGRGEHTVLSFVRWAHNVKWDRIKKREGEMQRSLERVWRGSPWEVVFSLALIAALATGIYSPDPDLARGIKVIYLAKLCTDSWALAHFPRYIEFVYEVYVFYAVWAVKLAFLFVWLLRLLGVFADEEEWARALSRREMSLLLRDVGVIVALIYSCIEDYSALASTQRTIMEKFKAGCGDRPPPSPWALFRDGIPFDTDWTVRKQRFRAWLGLAPPDSNRSCRIGQPNVTYWDLLRSSDSHKKFA